MSKISRYLYLITGNSYESKWEKGTIENDNGLVSIKGTGKRTIVEVSSTYPTTMILSLLISSITFIFLFTRYLIRCCG